MALQGSEQPLLAGLDHLLAQPREDDAKQGYRPLRIEELLRRLPGWRGELILVLRPVRVVQENEATVAAALVCAFAARRRGQEKFQRAEQERAETALAGVGPSERALFQQVDEKILCEGLAPGAGDGRGGG